MSKKKGSAMLGLWLNINHVGNNFNNQLGQVFKAISQ